MEVTYSDTLNDDAHSPAASIEDFEEQERRSPLFSGFRSDRAESEVDDGSSAGGLPWSPRASRVGIQTQVDGSGKIHTENMICDPQ